MQVLTLAELTVIALAAAIYIAKAWAAAQRARDLDFATRPGAGILRGEMKPSALPYLFR